MLPTLGEEEIVFLERIMQRGIRELEMHLPQKGDPSPYFIGAHPKLAALHISRDRPF
ncbi:hypothetical protein FRC01_006227, partial [Tulasnella sp. 417]